MADAMVLHPDRVAFLARIVTGEATSARVARLLRQTMRSSPPDLAAFESDAAVNDYARAVRHFAAGRVEGFIAEQRFFAKPASGPAPQRSDNWRFLLGVHDPLHSSDHSETHWRTLMPAAHFTRISDGGRFLFLTHADAVIAALRD